jgi:CarD family transcriptional regulator
MGDTVVHPRHGVATVSRIATRGAGTSQTSYLELAFVSKSLTVLVPTGSVEDVGIRQLPTKQEAAAILKVLARPSDVSERWAERSASTTARMQSADLAQASMVIRDLTTHARRSGKRLSASENAILESCLDTVSAQLSLVLDLSQEETRALILQTAATGD